MASPDRPRPSPHVPSRAIIDIGSNTVRLVIYGGPPRAPEILHNEKVSARLGKGVAETGALAPKAAAAVLASLRRYRALLDLSGVKHVEVVATAAVRDARDGADFLEQVRAIGFTPRLLSGEEEAVTSAHGVSGAFPRAKGVVGDLGGGSLELVDVDEQGCRHGVSMPLGTLRLPALRANGDAAFARRIGGALDKAEWQAAPGATLYLVGGSLRAFARHAMVQLRSPIDDPHGFELSGEDALKLAQRLARMKPEAVPPLPGVSGSRLAALPDTAALLSVLVRKLAPGRIVFSSWGLREGLMCEAMPPAVRGQDPLLAGVSAFIRDQGIAPSVGTMVAGWTVAARFAESPGRREPLRLAATMLCLASARIEPNLRADHARDWAMRKRWIGIDATERAMLAAAIQANTGKLELPVEILPLLTSTALREAQAWGLATRLCRRFSGATPQGLSGSGLTVEDGNLVLAVRPELAVLVNEGVQRDLKALATHLELKPAVR